MAEGDTREEVLATYAHPYRRGLPVAYRLRHLREMLAALLALIVLTAGLAVVGAGSAAEVLGLVAIVGAVGATVWALDTTVSASIAIRAHTADWRAKETHELARVRTHRPHAGEGEGRYASTQYAVAIGDAADLVTWAFEPLASHEQPAPGHVLLRGTPRYAACAVERVAFDAHDTARAAEQLVEAQALAAAWEADAAEQAAAVREGLEAATELAEESASTGAALRRITGQSPR